MEHTVQVCWLIAGIAEQEKAASKVVVERISYGYPCLNKLEFLLPEGKEGVN